MCNSSDEIFGFRGYRGATERPITITVQLRCEEASYGCGLYAMKKGLWTFYCRRIVGLSTKQLLHWATRSIWLIFVTHHGINQTQNNINRCLCDKNTKKRQTCLICDLAYISQNTTWTRNGAESLWWSGFWNF